MMREKGFLTLRALILSILLHCAAAALLFVSFEFEPKVITPPPAQKKVKVIDAVTIDKKQLEIELKKLQDDDQAAKQKEAKRQKELKQKAEAEKKKAKEAEQKRKAEEKKIALAKEQQKKEEQRIADLKKKEELEREKAKKAIEERKRLEAEKEAEKKKLEEQKKKAAEEKKKAEEAKRKAEEEKRRKAKEAELQAQLDAEMAAEQEQRDLTLIEKYVRAISGEIRDQFNTQALPEGLSCKIQIRMVEGGSVVEATVIESSGNELFDRRARTAVYAASPLPVPDEARLFEKMQSVKLIFKP